MRIAVWRILFLSHHTYAQSIREISLNAKNGKSPVRLIQGIRRTVEGRRGFQATAKERERLVFWGETGHRMGTWGAILDSRQIAQRKPSYNEAAAGVVQQTYSHGDVTWGQQSQSQKIVPVHDDLGGNMRLLWTREKKSLMHLSFFLEKSFLLSFCC